MTQSKTDQKLAIVQENALPLFKKGDSVEKIVETLIVGGISGKGIGVLEVGPLVKHVGKANGFILTPDQRQENAINEITERGFSEIKTYEDLENFVESIINNHSTAVQWTWNKVKGMMTEQGYHVPKKSSLTDWQKAVINAFVTDHKSSRNEIDRVIGEAGIQNASHYGNLVHEMIYRLLEEIDNQ